MTATNQVGAHSASAARRADLRRRRHDPRRRRNRQGTVPANPLSIFLALLISAGSWGVVSWAVTTAIVDVESDIERGTGG